MLCGMTFPSDHSAPKLTIRPALVSAVVAMSTTALLSDGGSSGSCALWL